MRGKGDFFCILKRHSYLIVVLFFVFPFSLSAAFLYMDPSEGVVSSEQMFTVDVRVDNQDQCLNVFDVKIKYPSKNIKAVTVSRGKSILSLWVEDPIINHKSGEITFTGGIPGGYCGRVSGDLNLTNVLVTLVFQPLNKDFTSDKIEINFAEDTSILLSDGAGSEAELDLLNAVYDTGENATVLAEEWLEILRQDERPPVAFDIELMKEESVFDGNYFIVFSTTDKGSGLKHYEVKEEDIDKSGFIRDRDKEASFIKIESPYLLKDQTLNSRITVKAIDNAGNERLSWYEPDESIRVKEKDMGWELIQSATSWMTKSYSWIVFLLALVAFAGVFFLLSSIKKKRKQDLKNEINESSKNLNV
jgi:hypothetical protein